MDDRKGSSDYTRQTLFSVREAAEALSVAVPTLRRWIREKRLAHVRCGRAVRIELAELTRFIERNRHPAAK
jgi:excisionase family DNA binding protein